MAKVIVSDSESQIIGSYYPILIIIVMGLVSGLLFCLLAWLVRQYVIVPLFCGSSLNVQVCLDAGNISGNIATILTAIMGMAAMVYLKLAQPLLVSLAVSASLWSLSAWTSGLPIAEIITWSALLYLISYILFSWLARNSKIWLTVIFMLLVVLIIRLRVSI